MLASPALAEEKIDLNQIEITINQDSSINVTETILYDFDGLEKHGIYRDIPFKYQNNTFGNFNIKISDISVIDEKGNSYNYSVSTKGQNKSIKIGDANYLVSGLKTYIIKYKVSRAITFFKDHDELYWNAVGSDWSIPINESRVVVSLSPEIDFDQINLICYSGPKDSQTPCTESKKIINPKNDSTAGYFYQKNVMPGDFFTIALSFPKGFVKEPSTSEKVLVILKENLIFILPILVLIICTTFWYLWGKDPKGRGVIITQFDIPDNLSPTEVGIIMDNHIDNVDISGEIIYLATLGYIKIHQVEDKSFLDKFSVTDNYILEKLKGSENLPNEFQKMLMNNLFSEVYIANYESNGKKFDGVKLSSLKKDFAIFLKKIKKEAYENLVLKGYFVKNPATLKAIYLGLAFVILFSIMQAFEAFNYLTIISIGLSAIIIVFFSILMPKKTLKGVLTKEYILGLKSYLNVAEKDRLAFHNAPEKKPEVFEKLLPFAMVLGVDKQWAKQFEGIYIQNPSWYDSPTGANFNSLILVNNLHSFNSAASSMIKAANQAANGGSGFSGGGSGGGFGGGGGGSW